MKSATKFKLKPRSVKKGIQTEENTLPYTTGAELWMWQERRVGNCFPTYYLHKETFLVWYDKTQNTVCCALEYSYLSVLPYTDINNCSKMI